MQAPAALLKLYRDPALCESLGAGGRAHVQTHYDWRVISDSFLDLQRAPDGATT